MIRIDGIAIDSPDRSDGIARTSGTLSGHRVNARLRCSLRGGQGQARRRTHRTNERIDRCRAAGGDRLMRQLLTNERICPHPPAIDRQIHASRDAHPSVRRSFVRRSRARFVAWNRITYVVPIVRLRPNERKRTNESSPRIRRID